ncbi:hypothetical protein LR48_Vigan11g055200 [Vigna angularis]|uniref:Homeobox domain-containing protein n=1 Tax=Phaseolus angularis TaxID=3914 RepID=A0A0L9VS06_PHAAN|nr:hypothetical protein LR48_Vigan11g055200 [Vigna angularis]
MNQNLTNLEVQDKIGYKRWAPTREQVALLEAIFAFGIRNPNREQIHEIATRLKVYGEIGCYNVGLYKGAGCDREQQDCVKMVDTTAGTVMHPLLLEAPWTLLGRFSSLLTAPCVNVMINFSFQP